MIKYNPMTDGLENLIKTGVDNRDNSPSILPLVVGAAVIGFGVYMIFTAYHNSRSHEITQRHYGKISYEPDYGLDGFNTRLTRGRGV